ncbi:hypothetical protein FRC17_002109 [Serendipita sp. 399]|nr:hypothetical protein FRC17_002109 [Serendipita sp. 399]
MFKLAILAAALAAAPVFGQSTAGIPQCVLDCTTQSLAAGGCTSITDLQCICTNQEFQTAAAACITTGCPESLPQAIALQTAQCSAVSGTGTAVPSETGSTSGTGTASGGSASTSLLVSVVSSASTAAASTTSRPNAGFESASIASGAAVALFAGIESTPAETGTGTGSASGSASTSRLVSSAVSSASTAAPTTSRPNAGFESASIASGAGVALFGAALALF